MKMELVPFKKEHALLMADQAINVDVGQQYKDGMAAMLEEQTHSMTVMVDGVPMCSGGVIPMWPGRGCVWTLFNQEAKFCFVTVLRGIRKFLALQMLNFERLEIAVPVGFSTGHRRAVLLGFVKETELARKYLPDGTDCSLYSMVRE